MNLQLEETKKIFYASGLVVVTGGILSLIYYAYLMPFNANLMPLLVFHMELLFFVKIVKSASFRRLDQHQ